MLNFIFSLVASLVAAIIVLFLERMRLPELKIIADIKVNTVNTYGKMGTWKFIRLKVINKEMPLLLRFLIRETAENCRAILYFFNEGNELLFQMKGRWADTPELPHVGQDAILKIYHPDPISITRGKEEVLDVVVMKQNESDAYGWNNEAYLNNWKTPLYKIPKGKYNIKINITTQNGVSFSENVLLKIGDNIENTFLENISN